MDEDTVADLKQFIATTIRHELTEAEQRLEQKLEQKLDEKLAAQTSEILSAVADVMHSFNEHTETTLDNHEKRITRL